MYCTHMCYDLMLKSQKWFNTLNHIGKKMMLPVDVPNKSKNWSGPIVFTPVFFGVSLGKRIHESRMVKVWQHRKTWIAIMKPICEVLYKDFRGLSMPQASHATIKQSPREVVYVFAVDVRQTGSKAKECRWGNHWFYHSMLNQRSTIFWEIPFIAPHGAPSSPIAP